MEATTITCHARDCARSGTDLVRGRTTCPEHYGIGMPVTRFKKSNPSCVCCDALVNVYSGDCPNECRKQGLAGTKQERDQ